MGPPGKGLGIEEGNRGFRCECSHRKKSRTRSKRTRRKCLSLMKRWSRRQGKSKKTSRTTRRRSTLSPLNQSVRPSPGSGSYLCATHIPAMILNLR